MSATLRHEYEEFELLVGNHTAQGYPVVLVHSPAGEYSTFCQCDPADAELLDAIATLSSTTVDGSFVTDFGNFLFTELFTGDLASLYHASLNMVRGQGKQLRLRLRIEPPALAHLPWEYLYDRREESFLAISSTTALVRHIPLRLPTRPTSVRLPLRILLVIANPLDLPQLDIEQEQEIILEALQDWTKSGKIQLQVVEQATLAQIGQAIRTLQPHVFHFVGHGQFEQESASIALQDETGKAHFVDESLFRELFAGANEMRLAVLNSCQTATLSASQPLVGLAPRLLQRNLSAVVAMQFPIADHSALIFAREFYRSLAAGYPMEAAVAEARKGMHLTSAGQSADWGAPVLFLRAKDGQLFDLQVEQKSTRVAPPEPTRPPFEANFIGRDADLAHYLAVLNRDGVAIISGMAGVGKTSLAVTLVERCAEPSKAFWHVVHPNEGIDTILWKLAGFLAWNGKEEPWQMLQSTLQQGGAALPPAILFDYLMQSMTGQGFLLCFDDLHHVGDNPLLPRLMEQARSAIRAGDLRLIITTRHWLDLGFAQSSPALTGLNVNDGLQLLHERGVRLEPELSLDLYHRCMGNAALLMLAANALRQTKEPARMIGHLAESGDIERFLLEEIDKHLSHDEKAVMSAVAVLVGDSGTRDVIEEILEGRYISHSVSNLVSRHLLTVSETELGREYRQHAIVQAFYYNLLGRRQRHEMHQRAGEFYEFEEVDDLRAALHYHRSGNEIKAAQLCIRNVWIHISQGRAQVLRTLINSLPLSQLDAATQAALWIALGDLDYLVGALTSAVQHYEKALTLAESIDPATQIQLWRKLGDVLAREGDYPQALLSFANGHRLLLTLGESRCEWAMLAVGSSTVLLNLGRYDEAKTEAQAVLTQTDSASQPRLVADARDLLGKIAYFQGDFETSIAEFQIALDLRQRLNDQREILKSHSNLAVVYGEQNQHEQALQINQSALEIAERIGDAIAVASLFANMGTEYESLGKSAQALELHGKALALYEKMGSQAGLMTAHHNLGDIYSKMQQFDSAVDHLQQAIGLAEQLNEPDMKLSSLSVMAEVQFRSGRTVEALGQVLLSMQIADEIEHKQWLPFNLTLLGQIYFKLSNFSQARAAFRKAAEIWHERSQPKQLVGIWLEWACVEQADGDQAQALALCEQALQCATEHNMAEVARQAEEFRRAFLKKEVHDE